LDSIYNGNWFNGKTSGVSAPDRYHLLDDHFKIEYLDNTADDDLEMRKNEKGFLRYIAGFICRHLRKQLECERTNLKKK